LNIQTNFNEKLQETSTFWYIHDVCWHYDSTQL